MEKYLRNQFTVLRITNNMQTIVANYGHRSEIVHQKDPIFGDKYLESFVPSTKSEFTEAMKTALKNIKSNTL